MKKLKLFFACLLMAVLSIGQVWATDPVLSADFTAKTAGKSDYKSEWTYGDFTIVNAANNNKGWAYMKFGGKSADISTYNPCYVVSPKVTVAISSIDVITNAGNLTKGSVNSWGVYVYSDADLTVEIDHVTGGAMTAQTAETLTLTPSNSATSWPKDSYYKVYFDLANTTTTNGVVWVDKINWYEYEDTPSPSVSVNPSSWNFGTVHASDAASKVFSVSGSNLTAGDLTLTVPTGFSVSPSSIAVDGTLAATEVTVSKNTSTEDDYAGNLEITGGGLTSAKTVALTMTVDADPAPTGTFKLYSGDIAEGDYVIYYNGRAMNTTVTSNRLQYAEIAPVDNKITNPDASIIWHIAASGDYWTLYNTALGKYAASTNAKNQATIADGDLTDNMKWTITGSSTYEFENLARSSGTDPNNKWLRNNGTYGFACYTSTQSGTGPLSLYKLDDGKPDAPTFSPAGGSFIGAQNVTLSATDADEIRYTLDGSAPTTTSALFENPIPVSETTTIKAIAIKNGVSSNPASATYTITVPYTTIPAIFAAATSTSTQVYITFDGWKISYVKGANNAYLTDGTNGLIIYESGHGFSVGDVLTGTAACNLVLFKGAGELTGLTSSTTGLTVTPGSMGDAVVKTIDQLGAVNTGALVTINNVTYDGTNLSDGTNTIKPFNSLYSGMSFTNGGKYNVTGIVSYYDVLQILPRSATDIEEVSTKYTVTYNNAPDNGTLIIKNGDDVVTSGSEVNENTILTIIATPDDGYSLSAVTVNGSAYTEATLELTENVTVSATFVEDVRPAASLKLMENGNEVAFPGDHKQNDHVTLPTTVSHECAGRVFVGWSAVEVAQTDVKPSYNEPGADFVLSAAGVNTLYAVYAAVATPASYQKLESDAFDGTAKYVIGALNGDDEECFFYYYESVDANIWGKMSNDPATNAPILFTLSGTAEELVAQDAAGNYLKPISGKFQMSATENNFILGSDGTLSKSTYNLRYNSSGDYGLRWYTNTTTGTSAYFYKVIAATYNKYSTTCDAAIDAPEFTPAEGTYTSAQNITISAATGATIYYTTDGTDPTKESSVYSAAIPLNEAGTTTIKAFAVKGEAESDIASATYTINLPLTTMDQIFAKANAVGSTATDVTIVFNNWVISGLSTNGKSAYLTDGEKGLIIFDNSATAENPVGGFEVGNILSGTVDCKLQKYNGASEVTTLTSSTTGLTVTTGGVITPVEKAISALSGVNTGAPIVVSNVKFDGTNLVDASDNEIQPYTTLYADAVTLLTTNKYYNVTGIYTQFNSKKEILPRSADDIEELTQEAPTMTWYTSDAKTQTIAANAKYSIDLGDDFAPVFETNSTGDLTYSSSNTTVAEINETTGALTLKGVEGETTITCAVAAAGNYTAGSQGFILKVREGSSSDNVVILAQYNGTWYAMKNTGVTSKTAAALEVVYSDGKVWNLSAEDQAAITWKRTVDGEGNVTFQAPNDDYLKTSSDDLAQSAGESGVYQWNWNDTYYRTGTKTRTFIYRVSANGFKNFAVSNAGTSDYSALPVVTTALFATGENYTEIRSGLEINRYYSVCLPKQVTAVKGATFWSLTYKDQDEATMVYIEEETAPFDAGKPYIFQATSTTLEVVYDGDAVDEPVENGALRGTFSYMSKSALDAVSGTVYLLIQNKLRPITTGNYLNANRAYILYNELIVGTPTPQPGRQVRKMPMEPQVATGIDALNVSDKPVKMVIDGQLFIIRGEKMYDATGRLVK